MSLRPQTVPSVPEETARIPPAAFPKGNLYMQIWDEIGILLTDADSSIIEEKRLIARRSFS